MSLPQIISNYFEAWNRHDPDAIVACFTQAGLYHDPYVPDGIGGAALQQYTHGVFAAMTTLRFEIVAVYSAPDAIIVEWLMVAEPRVRVPGVDIFTIEDEHISKVQGYYDRKTFESQQIINT
jgi:limonene-1,2-epoxide hydrolase